MSGGGPATLQIYGAGRTGLAVARLAAERGVPLAGVWNRSPLSGARAELAQGLPVSSGGPLIPVAAGIWLLAVSDDAIAGVASELAAGLAGGPRPRAVAHCAGARPVDDLDALRQAGVPCATWHPAMTFRGVRSDSGALAGACAAIAGDPEARTAMAALSEALGVGWHPLVAAHEPRYHSALVLAANGRVILEASARRLLADAGLDAATIRRVLDPLVARTEENLRAADPVEALTGPVARGDAETVRATLDALRDHPEIERLYRALAAAALTLVPASARVDGHRTLAALIETEAPQSW